MFGGFWDLFCLAGVFLISEPDCHLKIHIIAVSHLWGLPKRRWKSQGPALPVWVTAGSTHPLYSGPNGQDIPFSWEEMKLKIQGWAHFFLVPRESYERSAISPQCCVKKGGCWRRPRPRHVWWASSFHLDWFLNGVGDGFFFSFEKCRNKGSLI